MSMFWGSFVLFMAGVNLGHGVGAYMSRHSPAPKWVFPLHMFMRIGYLIISISALYTQGK